MKNKVDYIIARILAHEASSDDMLLFSQWLNESDSNKQKFRLLKSYWDAEVSFNNTLIPSISSDKMEQALLKQIHKNKIRHFIRITIPAAATIALLLGLSVFLFSEYSKKQVKAYYTYITDDHKSSFTMNDGTIVTLNKNSRLKYTDNFNKNDRGVILEGEAYFEVAKDPSKPFYVDVNNARVTVLGTHFNVKEDKESDIITTTLIEGSVLFEANKDRMKMEPNQQLVYCERTQKMDVNQVDADSFISWKTNLLKYKSIPFIYLISDLEKNYSVSIQVENQSLLKPDVTVSGTFEKDQNIEQILKVIAKSLPIRWHNNDGIYYIR